MDEKLLSKINRMKDAEFCNELVAGRFSEAELKSIWINRQQLTEFRKAVILDFLDEEDED